MKCKKTAILTSIVLSFAISSCGSSSSSTTTGYDVNLSDTISQLTIAPPSSESFTMSGLSPACDAVFVPGDSKNHKYVTTVLKVAKDSLGFAFGEYTATGKLLYKMVSIFTITSASAKSSKDQWMLPSIDTTEEITYTLTAGSSTLLVTTKEGAAPKRFTASGTAITATIKQTAKADSTATPATPATYSIAFSSALSPSFSGASCTISGAAVATGTSIAAAATN
jgi:hypothetical protein